jgi:hypothetical protein
MTPPEWLQWSSVPASRELTSCVHSSPLHATLTLTLEAYADRYAFHLIPLAILAPRVERFYLDFYCLWKEWYEQRNSAIHMNNATCM